MTVQTSDNDSDEQDWRLEAELDVTDIARTLRDLIGRLHEPALVKEVEAKVPHDVVITHDEQRLFAYAASETVLKMARSAIEGVLRRDGIKADIRISCWNDELDCWRQTDPPPTAEEKQRQGAADHDAETEETRTLVASSGKLIRAEFEQIMSNWAGKLGVSCEIIEHPHLLTTQVAFTVTGPRHKIDEFSQGLTAEELATIRTEARLMMSPL